MTGGAVTDCDVHIQPLKRNLEAVRAPDLPPQAAEQILSGTALGLWPA